MKIAEKMWEEVEELDGEIGIMMAEEAKGNITPNSPEEQDYIDLKVRFAQKNRLHFFSNYHRPTFQ